MANIGAGTPSPRRPDSSPGARTSGRAAARARRPPGSSPAPRRDVAGRIPGPSADSLGALGEGTDHAAYLLDGRLVVRIDRERDAARVEREAQLLDAVAAISPFRVPKPVLVAASDGCLVYEQLPGACLLDVPPATRLPHATSFSRTLPLLTRPHDP